MEIIFCTQRQDFRVQPNNYENEGSTVMDKKQTEKQNKKK